MTVATTEVSGVVVPPVSQQTMALFAQMAVTIPEADDENAYENIVAKLLSATNLDDLNAPWDTTDSEALAGQRLKIDTVKRRASDFQGGLGLYLICEGVNTRTGEPFVWTTGSVAIVAQLVRAHVLGGFPVFAEIVLGDANAETGHRPQHLKVTGFGGSK